MKLIIVESPTKARTLTKFLNPDRIGVKGEYRVEATMGHIRDLPKTELGVDIVHDFEPRFIVPRDRQKRVKELKDLAKKADAIILATDPDREGEAIAFHTAELLKDMKGTKKRTKKTNSLDSSSSIRSVRVFSRIVFHEITETAIKEAIENPREIDLQLVDAQQARRILDRLVGYKLSPLLWQKLSRKWLSAGRVQSVAVRLIVEREREIEKFSKEEYWTIEGIFHSSNSTNLTNESNVSLRAQLVSKDSMKYEQTLSFDLFDGKYTTTKTTIADEALAKRIIDDLKSPFTVSAVETKEIKRYPLPPHTTSTLQQDAGRRFYFSAKKTMQTAQKLYEEGRITYHRTDSVNLAEKFITEARTFIKKTYGENYVATEARRYKTKSKVAQEAHEAIRPTDANLTNLTNESNGEFNHDHVRLYDLIWKRAVASQAHEAVFDSTTIDITSVNGLPAGRQGYQFETQGSVIKFDGYLKITGKPASLASLSRSGPAGGENGDILLPKVTVGEELNLKEAVSTEHFTSPPPRYTEASLIKTLEEKGIGRPSTYAPTLSTIVDRQYVTKEDLPAGRQGKKLIPTELGFKVTDFLVLYFPTILDLPFTATLEDKLDEIANGNLQWVPVVREFYEPFALLLETAYEEGEKVKMVEELLDEKCPLDAGQLVIKTGRYGKFVACMNFPTCKYTRQFAEKIDMKCPRCGGDIVIKKSRRGKQFYGCSNYPTCNFAAWKKEEIK